jgi:Dimerisation and cyclophilin-binding domain of Mon2
VHYISTHTAHTRPYTLHRFSLRTALLTRTRFNCADSLDEDDKAAAAPDAAPRRHSKNYRNVHFVPLRLACESGNAKLTVTALDTLAKLCAHGYFRDVVVAGSAAAAADAAESTESAPGTPPGPAAPPKTFADLIVETVCKCELDTEQVQLQVIKALLTVVTCSSLEVHEASLLLAVRTIYTVHLR